MSPHERGPCRGTLGPFTGTQSAWKYPLKECTCCCCCNEDSATNCKKPDLSRPCDHLPCTLKTFLHSFYPPHLPYCVLLAILTCLPVHRPARRDLISRVAVDPLLQAPSQASVKNKRQVKKWTWGRAKGISFSFLSTNTYHKKNKPNRNYYSIALTASQHQLQGAGTSLHQLMIW